MNDHDDEMPEPDEIEGEEKVETSDKAPSPAEPTPELPSARTARASTWDSSSRPGKWATIGCGLGIVVLVAALFAGSSLLKKTVWAGFAGAGKRLVANLPGDLPPGERMRLTRNLDRFAAQVKQQEEPYEVIGDFQRLARAAMEDGRITRSEVDEINLFLEEQLRASDLNVPFSMP